MIDGLVPVEMPDGSIEYREPVSFGPVDGEYFETHDEYVRAISKLEKKAIQVFTEFVEDNRELLSYVSRWGDGDAGLLSSILKEVLFGPPIPEGQKPYRKKKIDGRLRIKVFERDAYRCVKCGSWEDLCADHIYPESLGGESTMENLQTLCRPCNTSKGAKVEEVMQ